MTRLTSCLMLTAVWELRANNFVCVSQHYISSHVALGKNKCQDYPLWPWFSVSHHFISQYSSTCNTGFIFVLSSVFQQVRDVIIVYHYSNNTVFIPMQPDPVLCVYFNTIKHSLWLLQNVESAKWPCFLKDCIHSTPPCPTTLCFLTHNFSYSGDLWLNKRWCKMLCFCFFLQLSTRYHLQKVVNG